MTQHVEPGILEDHEAFNFQMVGRRERQLSFQKLKESDTTEYSRKKVLGVKIHPTM